MSEYDEELRASIRRLTKPSDQVIVATVLSVDLNKMTADVAPLTAPDVPHFAVRLAAADTPEKPVVCVPAVGSTVLVASIGHNWQGAYVAMFSEVATVLLRGDEFGGIPKVAAIVERLNRLEERMATHQHLLSGTPTTADDVLTNQPFTPTTAADLENPNVTHG